VPRNLYQDARLVIEGERFVLWTPIPDAEQRVEGSLRIDPTKEPKQQDVSLDSGQVVQEIYELDGDTLQICYPVRGGARPTALESTPGSGLSLVVYRRDQAANTATPMR